MEFLDALMRPDLEGLWWLHLSVLGVGLFVYAAVVVAARVIAATRGPKFPQCRRCRYPVYGLPSEVCPECGSDLRGTGTAVPNVPARRASPGRPRRVIGLTALHVVWWPLVLLHLQPYAPTWVTTAHRTRTPVGIVDAELSGLHPLPLPVRRIYLEAWNRRDPLRPRAQRMIIHPGSLGYAYWNVEGQRVERAAGFNEAVIVDFLQSIDVQARREDVARAAQQIRDLRAVRYVDAGKFLSRRAQLVRASAVWWGLWAAGVASVVLRRRV